MNNISNKISNSYVYTSHPERGLDKVYNHVKSIGGHLYVATPEYGIKMLRDNFSYLNEDESVTVMGTLPQKELYNLMSTMEHWYYPTEYNETFCLTALEMMAHGVIPDTSLKAGLKEVVGDLNKNSNPKELQSWVSQFDWEIISKEWEDKIIKPSLIYMKKQKHVFDKTYCICLNPTPSKEKDIRARYKKLGVDVPIEIVAGVDVSILSDQEKDYTKYKGWAINSTNHWWNRPVTDGEVGCSLAHTKAWQKIIDDKVSAALILEEDFEVLSPLDQDIIREFDTPREWDIWYLGGNPVTGAVRTFGDSYIPSYMYNSHAYIVTSVAAKKFQNQPYKENMIVIDEFLSATYFYSEHPRKDLHSIFTRNIKAMAMTTEIVKQTSTPKTSKTTVFKHQDLFQVGNWDEWVERWIHPVAKTKQWDLILDEPITDVLTFPLFNEDFCEAIIQEAERNAKWEHKRHKFYPTVDTLLETFEFDSIWQRVLREFVFPAAISHWKLDGDLWPNMTSENFMVKYSMDAQGHLNLHHDFSSITSLVTLNNNFTGGGTYFSKQNKTYKGIVGEVSIHPGAITHRHGGRPIHSGERYIIVSFCNKP